ncbi:MAG: hypothetical protein GY809_09965, partial [Planctomycetes bacterium]|nr:hypothetical protein [Planctomycetota bacterium]
ELRRQAKEQLRQEQRRKQCHALVSTCKETIRGVTDTAIQQLASKDLIRFSDELRQASRQIDAEPDRAHKSIKATQKQLNRTLAQAEANAKQWSDKQAQARAQLRAMEQDFGAEKQVANEAGHKVLAELNNKITQAKTLYQEGHYKESKKLCKISRTVLKEASQATLDETIRRKVVGGLLSTLMSMGFVTEAPQLHGDEPDTNRVRLTGRMPSGRTATFEVKLDGQMSFDLDGYQGKACAKDMDQISSILQRQLDLKMGPAQFT